MLADCYDRRRIRALAGGRPFDGDLLRLGLGGEVGELHRRHFGDRLDRRQLRLFGRVTYLFEPLVETPENRRVDDLDADRIHKAFQHGGADLVAPHQECAVEPGDWIGLDEPNLLIEMQGHQGGESPLGSLPVFAAAHVPQLAFADRACGCSFFRKLSGHKRSPESENWVQRNSSDTKYYNTLYK